MTAPDWTFVHHHAYHYARANGYWLSHEQAEQYATHYVDGARDAELSWDELPSHTRVFRAWREEVESCS